jgi:hypothetical protein
VIANLKKAGVTHLWGNPLFRYKAQQMGYAMAHIIDCPPRSRYIKKDKSMAIIMQSGALNALSQFITLMRPDDKRKLLDPTIPAPAIELSITRGAKSNAICDITTDVYRLPALVFKDHDGQDIPYNGLDDIYIKNDETLSDEDFCEFRKGAMAELEKFRALARNKRGTAACAHQFKAISSGVKPEEQKQEITAERVFDLPSPTGETDEIACPLWEGSKTSTRFERYKNARFGNKPMNQDGSSHATPFCMLCDVAPECVVLTRKNRTKPA